MDRNKNIVIIGAGPAGLACAYYIMKHSDYTPIILEETPYTGGISRTHEFEGNRMDLGGHRFFTKDEEVKDFWLDIFPIQDMPSKDDILLNRTENFQKEGINPELEDKVFLKRRRLSRIYFLKKFFDYPISLKPQTFINLGFKNVILAGFGYLYSSLFKRKENSLEDFYINRFGKPLYEMFFENYTQKLWGIHPSKISPDWGAQRVKGLSLWSVIGNCILKPFIKKENVETSLIEEFLYPKFGPGQFYEALRDKIKDMGGKIFFNQKVCEVLFEGDKVSSVSAIKENGEKVTYLCDCLISSMAICDLVSSFRTNVPKDILDIAQNLPYRDFMTVGLLARGFALKNNSKIKTVSDIIPDCWIYIQERDVKLGRLQIFNNWSPYMVSDLEHTVWLGLEYFCSVGDDMWESKDEDFINMAVEEISKIGIINKEDILKTSLVRVKKAYPAYFGTYKDFDKVKHYLNSIENLYCIGRNGQHRYNNMDHSILSGFEAARAIINKTDKDKIWNVNTENKYHEAK